MIHHSIKFIYFAIRAINYGKYNCMQLLHSYDEQQSNDSKQLINQKHVQMRMNKEKRSNVAWNLYRLLASIHKHTIIHHIFETIRRV